MSRPILSRPRTRVYGCNYDKGESYYKPMVDHLDRKYSGRPLFSEPRNSFADEIAARRSDIGTRDLAGTRHGVLGREPELDFEPRARAPLSADPFFDDEDTVFDSRGQRTSRLRRLPLSEDFANEVSATTRKLKARVSAIDADMEAESRSRASRFENDFMEKTKAVLEDAEMAFKRRPKFDHELTNEEKPSLTRWSKLLDSPEPLEDLASGAAGRALRTKARLADLESEMEEMAEKQAKRERRSAALRALVNENSEDRSLASQASKISIRSEKHVSF